jgi:toxin ParE1/3/4
MRVVWTQTALRGVASAYDYLTTFNPVAARVLAADILTAGDSLSHFPHRGRPVAGTGLREIVAIVPYVLRYRIEAQQVVILSIRHAARMPKTP